MDYGYKLNKSQASRSDSVFLPSLCEIKLPRDLEIQRWLNVVMKRCSSHRSLSSSEPTP